MDRDLLNLIADVLGTITGVMAILGVGGVLTWKIREWNDARLLWIGKWVLYSFKFGLCLLATLLFSLISLFFVTTIYFLVTIVFSAIGFAGPVGTTTHSSEARWTTGLIASPILFSILVLIWASIVDGSLRPWRWLRIYFRRSL